MTEYGSSRATEEKSASGQVTAPGGPRVVGRDVGRVGRIGRVIAGLWGVTWLAWHIPLWPDPDLARAGAIAAWALAVLVASTIAYHILGAWRRLQHSWGEMRPG